MKANSIDEIREHLKKGGRVICHVRANPGQSRHEREIAYIKGQVCVMNNGSRLEFDSVCVDHWQLLPLEEKEPVDHGTLKPCPFCGNDTTESQYMSESLHSHDQVVWHQISCRSCDFSMNSEDYQELETRWNTRVDHGTQKGQEEKPTIAEDLISGLEEFRDELRSGEPIRVTRVQIKPVIVEDTMPIELHKRIRTRLLHGKWPEMSDLLDWWEATTGERIEWGRRCQWCEGSGKQFQELTLSRVECPKCDRGYSVRPTWMGE